MLVGTTNDSKPVGDGVFMVSPKELKISEIEELFKKDDLIKFEDYDTKPIKPESTPDNKSKTPGQDFKWSDKGIIKVPNDKKAENGDDKVIFNDDETEILDTYDMATNSWKSNPIASMKTNPYSEMFGNKDFYYKLDGDSLIMAQKKEDLAWKPGAPEKVSGKLASMVIDGNKLIMAYLSALPVSGIMTPGLNLESLPKILEKLNLRLFVDLLTEGKDIVGVITIKYNPDPGILP